MKKMLNFKILSKVSYIILSIICLLGLVTCDNFEDPKDLQISATDNITTFLENNSSEFSLFLEMLNRDITLSDGNTIKYSSFLNAYAGDYNGYTLFAPTNDAVNTYLLKYGYNSVSEIPSTTIKNLLDFHILADTVATTSFTDGKLGTATLYGQYLVIKSVVSSDNTAKIWVNKQAYITQKNISLGNGIVHVIDGVLEPSDSTIYQKIAANSDYSIFVEALNATGLADTLNQDAKTTSKWYTVIPVSNTVYSSLGINSYNDLKAKYSNDGDSPENKTDSLNLYIRFHILQNLNFVADFQSGTSYATLANESDVVPITVRNNTVIFNENINNGDTVAGVNVVRSLSDNSCNNGVIHVLDGDYHIILWPVKRVFFDFADYADIRSKVSNWGQYASTEGALQIYDADLKGISMYAKTSTNAFLYYDSHVKGSASTKRLYVNANDLQINPRTTAGITWIKFTTPFIAKGVYKVWVGFGSNGNTKNNDPATISIGTSTTDSVDMPNVVYWNNYLPARSGTLYEWDNTLYGQGYKRPLQIAGAVKFSLKNNIGFYLGIDTLTTSSTHWVKITALTNGGSSSRVWLDYIEFIPVDDDQIWPKPDQDATWYERPADGYNDTPSAIY